MHKYIDADVLNRQLKNGEDYYWGYTDDYRKGIKRGIEMAKDCARRMPAADVEPVRHSAWKYIDYGDGEYWAECQECGEQYKVKRGDFELFETCYQYCPACGAKLGGGSNEL